MLGKNVALIYQIVLCTILFLHLKMNVKEFNKTKFKCKGTQKRYAMECSKSVVCMYCINQLTSFADFVKTVLKMYAIKNFPISVLYKGIPIREEVQKLTYLLSKLQYEPKYNIT